MQNRNSNGALQKQVRSGQVEEVRETLEYGYNVNEITKEDIDYLKHADKFGEFNIVTGFGSDYFNPEVRMAVRKVPEGSYNAMIALLKAYNHPLCTDNFEQKNTAFFTKYPISPIFSHSTKSTKNENKSILQMGLKKIMQAAFEENCLSIINNELSIALESYVLDWKFEQCKELINISLI